MASLSQAAAPAQAPRCSADPTGHSWNRSFPFVATMCREGRAPKPVRLSPRCAVWGNTQIHAQLADPLGYRAE